MELRSSNHMIIITMHVTPGCLIKSCHGKNRPKPPWTWCPPAKICNLKMQKMQKMQKTQKMFQFLHYPVISSNLKLKYQRWLIYLDRYRLLVVPQKLQTPLFRKIYRTRESGRGLGNLKGFMDLPMDVAFEVSLRSLQKCASPSGRDRCKQHSSRLQCISIHRNSYNFPGSRSNLGLCLHLALLFSSGKLLIITPI